MRIIWNNKYFPPLNVINGKTHPYRSKGFLRHYNYRSDPKLYQGVFIRRITCSLYDCQTQPSIYWNYNIKHSCNHPRNGRFINRKYSPMIGYNNNWVIMNFIDYGTDDV